MNARHPYSIVLYAAATVAVQLSARWYDDDRTDPSAVTSGVQLISTKPKKEPQSVGL